MMNTNAMGADAQTQAHAGCFSPYMMISSTLQTIFGFANRDDAERRSDVSERNSLELTKAKEKFQDELEAQKVADIRAKMAVARKYRAEENFDRNILKHKTEELKTFFMNCLPFSETAVPVLMNAANEYNKNNYDSRCPLNVILLHTKQAMLKYDEIYDKLDKVAGELGNIVFRRWCDRDAVHNASILNIHAIMGNIPTLVVSPCFHDTQLYFTISMWEAQTEAKPMIRPLFAYDCYNCIDFTKNTFTAKGKETIKKKLTFVTTMISGCAHDSYMLITQGVTPTFPLFLKNNKDIVKLLRKPDNKDVCSFVLDEYRAMKRVFLENGESLSPLLDETERNLLAITADEALEELSSMTN